MPPSRIALRTRNEAHFFQARVAIYLHVLVRHVLLRLSRFFPYHCFPILLRGSSTAHGTLILQRALTVEVKAPLARKTDHCFRASGPRCRLPSDVTSSSVRPPPLFGFDPCPFQLDMSQAFPFLVQLLLHLRNDVLQDHHVRKIALLFL